MDINKCKNCKLCTLANGGKEHYCNPPFFPSAIAFSIPCKNRTEKECKEILDMCDEIYCKHNKGREE